MALSLPGDLHDFVLLRGHQLDCKEDEVIRRHIWLMMFLTAEGYRDYRLCCCGFDCRCLLDLRDLAVGDGPWEGSDITFDVNMPHAYHEWLEAKMRNTSNRSVASLVRQAVHISRRLRHARIYQYRNIGLCQGASLEVDLNPYLSPPNRQWQPEPFTADAPLFTRAA